jgi:hypothetical protein
MKQQCMRVTKERHYIALSMLNAFEKFDKCNAASRVNEVQLKQMITCVNSHLK